MSSIFKSTRQDRGGARYQPFFRRLTTKEGPTDYTNFKTTVWKFGTQVDGDPINLTLTHASPQEDINRTYTTINDFLEGALEKVREDSRYPQGLVHLSLAIPDSDFYYNYSPAGTAGVTLEKLLDNGRMVDIVDEISNKIQSGKDVYLNNNAELTVYLYQNKTGGARVREADKGTYIEKSRSVLKVYTPPGEYSCAARAMCAAKAHLEMNQKQWHVYRTNMKRTSMQSPNEREAYTLMEALNINPYKAVGKEEVGRMARHLGVAVHILDITNNSKPEYIYHHPEDNRLGLPDTYLLLNDDHYNTITNINAFHRSFSLNCGTEVCVKCHDTYDRTRLTPHRCDFTQTKKRKTNHFKIRWSAKDVECTEYIETLTPKPPLEKKVLYFDVETMPIGIHKETGDDEPNRDSPDISAYRDHFQYQPAPYIPRTYDNKDYKYEQRIYLIVVQDQEGNEHQFENRGESKALDQFIEFLNLPENEEALLISHFGGGFDMHFLLSRFLSGDYLVYGTEKAPLMRGQKVIQASFINKIKLLDSYNFIGQPLSSFPKVFDLDENLAKGYFPHHFARPENMNYSGPMPAEGYYEPDMMKPKAREKFLIWYRQQICTMYHFDFMQECREYCSMDVTLLRQGFGKLRQLFLELKDLNGKAIGVDILHSATIPSACYKVFRTYFLKPDTLCRIIPPPKDQYSMKSIMWLDYVMASSSTPLFIQHALNGGEVRLQQNQRAYPVDGFCEATNTVYSFCGCFFHGCSRCYEANTLNPLKEYSFPDEKTGEPVVKKVRMGELRMMTEEQNNRLRSRGYKVVVMWECDWDRYVKQHKLPTYREDLLHREPLNPRDSYYGGRTETIMCYFRITGNQRIHYVDVTSMYPAVMRDCVYPVGPPTVLKKDRDPMIPIHQFFGVAKVKISSPEFMHLPFLPTRSNVGKVTFGLGTIVGTYTSVELKQAVALGYEIKEIYEQWHYPHQSSDLFKEYVETFFELKKKAKEENNNGLATLAKICLNSMYGKLAESSANKRQTKIINTYEDLSSLLYGDFSEVIVNLLNDKVGYTTISKAQTIVESPDTNVVVASFVTAYARTKLYMEGYHVLQDKMLYADTDSLIYYSDNGEHLIPLDTTGELGLWTSELSSHDDYFYEFVSSGPKSYALKSKSGTGDMVKSKGFSLHYKNHQIFNFEKLKQQVISKAKGEDIPKMVLHQDEMIMRRQYFQIVVEWNRGKMINLIFDKRMMQQPDEDEEGEVVCVRTLPVHVTMENNN